MPVKMKTHPFMLIAPFRMGEVGQPIQILRVGKWHFDQYGDVQITTQDIRQFVENFRTNVRRQKLPINIEHKSELGSYGYIKQVYANSDDTELWVVPEYTADGAEQVKSGKWMYTSAEFYRDYEDAESGTKAANVLIGLAMTNYPRIKSMQEVSMSEPRAKRMPAPLTFDAVARELATILGAKETFTPTELRAILFADTTKDDDGDDGAPGVMGEPGAPGAPGKPGAKDPDNDGDDDRPGSTNDPDDDADDLAEDEMDEEMGADGKPKRTSTKVRKALPTSAFAFVKQRKILIGHPGNVHAAFGRFMQVQGVTDAERDAAWTRLCRAAKGFGISCPTSWHTLGQKTATKAADTAAAQGAPNPAITPTAQDALRAERKAAQKTATMSDEDPDNMPDKTDPANMAEHAAVAVKLADVEKRLAETETALAEERRQLTIERETRALLMFGEAVEKARLQGRVTPADAKRYLEAAPKLSAEMRTFMIEDVAQRSPVVPLAEIGSGAQSTITTLNGSQDISIQLAERAAQLRKDDPKLSPRDALLRAGTELKKGAH